MKKTNQTYDPSRRRWIARAGLSALSLPLLQADIWVSGMPVSFPAKDMFDLSGTFINSAYTHPMSNGSLMALHRFLDSRRFNGKGNEGEMSTNRTEAKASFAQMVNASPSELAWIPSTMAGENLILAALGIPGPGVRIVTDALHFEGSLYMYGELKKRGVDVHVIRPKDNRIDLHDMDAAVTRGTNLVALSLVSTVNGFQHDLKSVCEIAHRKGALVFADIIQAVGTVPMDVKDSGVDFCSTATYKWLMGDFGVGLLYVKAEQLARLKHVQYGYRQIDKFISHVFPFDPPGEGVYESSGRQDTGGHFEVGTLGNGGVAALNYSLKYLLEAGVAQIQAYRQPMIDKLQKELPRLGYASMTPPETKSAIASFVCKDAQKVIQPKLEKAGVFVSVYENRMRISPSFFNDMADIDRLLNALS